VDTKGLLADHGSVETIFDPEGDRPGAARDLRRAERVLDACEGLGVHVITYADGRYPERLRTVPCPPPVLYAVGRLDRLELPAAALVGARHATTYGRRVARQLGRALSEAGVCVVSGMAFGIDEAAHTGALDGPGGTVAVLAAGPERASPASLRRLYERLAREQLVVSEFPPGTSPLPARFPQRNRVIAGLAYAVVVVEAAARSGSSITAREALDAGREVMAVPGPIDSPASVGCNRLLRQGAVPVTGAEDVLEVLDAAGHTAGAQRSLALRRDPVADVMAALASGPRSDEALARTTGLEPGEMQALLLRLRLQGAVTVAADGRIARME